MTSLRNAVCSSLQFAALSAAVACADVSRGELSSSGRAVTPAAASASAGGGSSLGGATSRAGAGGAAATVAGTSAGGRTLSEAGGQSVTGMTMDPGGGASPQGGMAGATATGTAGAGAAGAGAAGAGAAGAPALPSATFTNVYNKVFLSYCLKSGCHNDSRKEPYFGTQQDTYAFFVQPNVIFPGDNPNYSAIYDYIAWQIMPPDPNPKVPQDGVDIVAGWIAAGALND